MTKLIIDKKKMDVRILSLKTNNVGKNIKLFRTTGDMGIHNMIETKADEY